MIEFLAPLLAMLSAATIIVAILYYRKIRNAQKEYEKARSIIEDVVFSFARELRKEANRTELVAYKVEGNAARADNFGKRIVALEKTVESMKVQVVPSLEMEQTLSSEVSNIELTMERLEASQETVKKKVFELEEEVRKVTSIPEIQIEPAIQIKRDKALAALTGTEIAVLDMLVTEGPKTAPEIKERVSLSREHTARLMKKLYEKGYLERETGKIPFRYSAKKEMEGVLRKTEPQNP